MPKKYDPYQVDGNETYLDIANKTGVPEEYLQYANGGAVVPPPSGSYINVPTSDPTATKNAGEKDYTPGKYDPYRANYAYNVTPTAGVNDGKKGGRDTGNTGDRNKDDNYVPMANPVPTGGSLAGDKNGADRGAATVEVQAQNVTDQIDAGIAPPSVTPEVAAKVINPVTGLPMTDADWQASGYTFNPATGQWERAGSGTAGSTTGTNGTNTANTAFANTASQQYYAANNIGFLDQKRWDPVRKKFVPIRQLINEGKLDVRTGKFNPHAGRGGGQAAPVAAPAQASNAGTDPSRTLTTNQGGG